MITNRSRLWWQEFSIAGVVVALASCSAGSTAQPELDEFEEPGAVSGELAVYMADYDDGQSETTYFLRDAAGNERRLHFESEPDITPGDMIKVWGTDRAEALEVKSFKLASKLSARSDLGTQVQPLIGQPERAPRMLCPVLVSVNGGAALAEASATTAFLEGPKSDNAYMIENSYGKDKFVGKTYGPFPYTMASACDYSGLSKAIKPMLAGQGCQHYAYVMSKVSGCAWAGLGAVGTSDKPQADTWYNGTTSCVAAIQEVMHNWGSLHSSAIACSGATIATGGITDTLAGCTHSEYGDRSDTLGGGCRHMNAWQKLYQKVWGGTSQGGPAGSCNAVKATSSGVYNLYPTEIPCNGVQAIQIPFPGGKTRTFQGSTLTSWYLEYRASLGAFDTGIVPQVQARIGVNPILPTQVGPRGSRVWIPNIGTANMALTAGKSFSDPAGGLTVTVMSIDPTKAVVQIDYPGGSGGPVCLDGMNSPFTPPGADNCTDAPRTDGGVPTGAGGAGGTGGAGGAGGGAGGAKADAGRDAAGGANPTGAGGSVGGAGGSAGSGVGGSGVGGSGVGGSGVDGGPAAGTGGVATGTGGSNGVGGSMGTGTAGQGTATGSTTTGGRGAGDLDGGCACRIESAPKRPSAGAYLALLLGGLFASRRRSAGRRQKVA